MSNKSVSDFVAATMDAVLKSEAHKSLFGTQYKFASDENDAKCPKCGKDGCECGDTGMADAPPPPPKKDPATGATVSGEQGQHIEFPADKITADKGKADDSFAWDDDDARKKKKKEEDEDEEDASFAWDDDDARRKKKKEEDEEDEDKADDMSPAVAFDVAIDSLLTASAALDSVGMAKSSVFSLKLASLVVEAKKKEKEKAKDKEKSKRDAQLAKDKASKAKEKEKAAKEKEKLKTQKEKDKAKADAQAAKDKAAKDKAKEKEKAEKEKAAAKAKAEKAKASAKK